MIESTEVIYAGESSLDYKCIQVSSSSGLFEETFLPSRNIIEKKIRDNDKPYFVGVEYEPLEFPITFYFEDELTEAEIRKAARWLNQQYYKEMYFPTRPSRRFYCMYHGETTHLHTGIRSGQVTLTMRCNSPYSYSPVLSSDTYDLSTNPAEGTDIVFTNDGDNICKPILQFEKVGNGDIRIVNLSNGGQELEMLALLNGEKIVIDNHHKDIETDIVGTYRYDNHNDVFLEMPYGQNYLKVYGKCKDFKFIYQFETLQG